MILGGGRETKESEIDLSVGILLKKKIGDKVEVGDVLAVLYANDEAKAKEAEKRYMNACHIGDAPVEKPALIKGII